MGSVMASGSNADKNSGLSRRDFLKLGASAGLALLAACTPAVAPTSRGTATSTSASTAAGSESAKLQMPSYVPWTRGPKPDLPGTADGVDAGYFSFPKNLAKSVATPPGNGEEVTALTVANQGQPMAMDQNAAWQAVNRAMGVTFKLTAVLGSDIRPKLNTLIASGDTPDLMYNVQVNVGRAPEFMRDSCADLTPYLAGDAVKDYPNLANIPVPSWRQTVFNGAMYAVPVPRAPFGYIWKVRQDLVDEAGVPLPTNADELKRFVSALTKPDRNQYGLAAPSGNNGAYGLVTGAGLLQIFRAPNNWRVTADGKLVKDFETDEYKAALAYARELFQAGVYHPKTPTYDATPLESDFIAGQIGSNSTTWGSYLVRWGILARANPSARLRLLKPFGFDGGQAMHHLGPSNFGMTFVKKGSPDRVKLLLRVLDFLAAPFGSTEADLLTNGLRGTHYTLDAEGTPVLTDQGRSEVPTLPWKYLTANPSVLYDPNRSQEFATVSQDYEKAMLAVGVPDPTVGLYSDTYTANNLMLDSNFYPEINQIVTGNRPLSALDELLQGWRTQGGEQARREYQDALAATK